MRDDKIICFRCFLKVKNWRDINPVFEHIQKSPRCIFVRKTHKLKITKKIVAENFKFTCKVCFDNDVEVFFKKLPSRCLLLKLRAKRHNMSSLQKIFIKSREVENLFLNNFNLSSWGNIIYEIKKKHKKESDEILANYSMLTRLIVTSNISCFCYKDLGKKCKAIKPQSKRNKREKDRALVQVFRYWLNRGQWINCFYLFLLCERKGIMAMSVFLDFHNHLQREIFQLLKTKTVCSFLEKFYVKINDFDEFVKFALYFLVMYEIFDDTENPHFYEIS